MAISDTINSLKEHIGNAYTAIGKKKGTVPANKNCENLKSAIESIAGGKEEQAKTVTIIENGTNKLLPDEGKTFSEVTVITDVPSKEEEAKEVDLAMDSGNQTINPTSGKTLSQVVVKKPATMLPENIKKDVNIGGVTGTLEPQTAPKLQTKTVTPTKSQQSVSPDSGYDGLSGVTVNAIPDNYVIPSGAVDITTNGTHNVSGKATANVNVPSKEEETKTVDLNMASGNQTITPTSGKVLSQVVVKKPATLVAGNVKKGVDIGGITGTLETQKEEEVGTATITENGSQTFSPTSGKVFSNFTVTTNVPTGVDTSDATAVASDILSGKTAYAKGVKLTGSVGTYDGTFVIKVGYWKASVSNLGAQDPSTVVFNTPADSVPKPWSEVEFNGDVFIKFPKMYKKIVTVTDNQITAFEIANKKIDDDYKLYPCFIDESGNELDYILVGKYMSKSSTTCNSVASGSVISQTISKGRTRARERGTGYQLMDWRIQRLWQDLVICVYKKIDINGGHGVTIDAIGLDWTGGGHWIDGFSHNKTIWVYSNSPSKYVDNPTSITNGYAIISTYTAPTLTDKEIKKLGYDSAQPFFNYPSEVVSNSSYNTYYCDAYYYASENYPISLNVASSQWLEQGAFNCYASTSWGRPNNVRLCYRPISS